MPRGNTFSDHEQGQMLTLRDNGWSFLYIAKRLNRSQAGIYQFLRNPVEYNSIRRSGRPPKLTPQASRRLLRAAHTGKYSSTQLQKKLDLPIKPRR
ncbi:hypothetical protein F444_22460, partial [Phytophthora nicotianae P1976]